MLEFEIFLRVQTFWRRPFVPSHNFCHPDEDNNDNCNEENSDNDDNCNKG